MHLLGFKCLDLKQTVAVNICVLQDLKLREGPGFSEQLSMLWQMIML